MPDAKQVDTSPAAIAALRKAIMECRGCRCQPCGHAELADDTLDALQSQVSTLQDQMEKARGFLGALSSQMYEPEIWMEIKAWLAATDPKEK